MARTSPLQSTAQDALLAATGGVVTKDETHAIPARADVRIPLIILGDSGMWYPMSNKASMLVVVSNVTSGSTQVWV
jgi:hypothetical protein